MCVSEPIPISNARHLTSDGLDDLTRARAEGRLCPRPVYALVVFLPWELGSTDQGKGRVERRGVRLMKSKASERETLTFVRFQINSTNLHRGEDSKRNVCCGITKPSQGEQSRRVRAGREGNIT